MGDITLAEVESFTLDHTKVRAPYVRLIGSETGPQGDVISNFDVRLVQPNEQEIPTGGLHTIEHTMAALLRPRLAGLIDFSPFGCRTGFHMIVWGEPSVHDVAKAVKSSQILLTILRGPTFLEQPQKVAAIIATIRCIRPESGHSR